MRQKDLIHTVDGRLFQARMWRKHAMDWDLPTYCNNRMWVEKVLQIPREECIRRARINIRLAKRLNKRAKLASDK